jgi:hypothetical protein
MALGAPKVCPLMRSETTNGMARSLSLLRGAKAQCGPGAVDGHLADGLHALAGQGRDKPVTVEICAELAGQ